MGVLNPCSMSLFPLGRPHEIKPHENKEIFSFKPLKKVM
jgi:hypothetical protein